ncbi:MAG: LppA family lipoprotein [Marmoricola sp.]
MVRRTSRGTLSAILFLVLAACLGGCDSDGSTPSKESTMSSPSTVSMESALARYDKMRREMIEALDEQIGQQSWGDAPNEDGIIRAACNDDQLAENVNMRTLVVKGTYPEKSWKRSAELVEGVGRKYGFDTIKVVVDRPGDFSMTGLAEDGASYSYGLRANTILGVHTGCHRWDTKPSSGG